MHIVEAQARFVDLKEVGQSDGACPLGFPQLPEQLNPKSDTLYPDNRAVSGHFLLVFGYERGEKPFG